VELPLLPVEDYAWSWHERGPGKVLVADLPRPVALPHEQFPDPTRAVEGWLGLTPNNNNNDSAVEP
ncbi:MAG: hypothetical protein KC457_27470, partial [Myxococcales bacterium]|nr:hypothetical protein [Myxococcales bacterium]